MKKARALATISRALTVNEQAFKSHIKEKGTDYNFYKATRESLIELKEWFLLCEDRKLAELAEQKKGVEKPPNLLNF